MEQRCADGAHWAPPDVYAGEPWLPAIDYDDPLVMDLIMGQAIVLADDTVAGASQSAQARCTCKQELVDMQPMATATPPSSSDASGQSSAPLLTAEAAVHCDGMSVDAGEPLVPHDDDKEVSAAVAAIRGALAHGRARYPLDTVATDGGREQADDDGRAVKRRRRHTQTHYKLRVTRAKLHYMELLRAAPKHLHKVLSACERLARSPADAEPDALTADEMRSVDELAALAQSTLGLQRPRCEMAPVAQFAHVLLPRFAAGVNALCAYYAGLKLEDWEDMSVDKMLRVLDVAENLRSVLPRVVASALGGWVYAGARRLRSDRQRRAFAESCRWLRRALARVSQPLVADRCLAAVAHALQLVADYSWKRDKVGPTLGETVSQLSMIVVVCNTHVLAVDDDDKADFRLETGAFLWQSGNSVQYLNR